MRKNLRRIAAVGLALTASSLIGQAAQAGPADKVCDICLGLGGGIIGPLPQPGPVVIPVKDIVNRITDAGDRALGLGGGIIGPVPQPGPVVIPAPDESVRSH